MITCIAMANVNLMQALRRRLLTRVCSSLTVSIFTFVFYLAPFSEALAQQSENTPMQSVHTVKSENKFGRSLRALKNMAREKKDKSQNHGRKLEKKDIRELRKLSKLLDEQHEQALQGFTEMEEDLVVKGVPQLIVLRHQDAKSEYEASYDSVRFKVQAVTDAKNFTAQISALDDLVDAMDGYKLEQTYERTDPDDLPWGTPDAKKTRKPIVQDDDVGQFIDHYNDIYATRLATRVINSEMLNQQIGPVAENLVETPDVEFSVAITAKALELDGNPVKIYNWVRNNIEFIPSFGSIQGADYTLQHGKGNAFDSASLLLALFRASNIPARYAYGTIEIPSDQVMNWVGGVKLPEAAQQILAQGGIPNVGRASGGRITHIRLEHVWVEAWVDYLPSGGSKHIVGDQWIPLDVSFKQYQYTEGQDFKTNVPFDEQAMVDEIMQTGTVDPARGFVRNVNLNAFDDAIASYQQEIENYIASQSADTTIGQALGTQKVISHQHRALAAGLPYRLVAKESVFSEIPSDLRHKFRYTLGTEIQGLERNRVITFEQSLPELAGKKHILSFSPATQADRELIDSYMPTPDPDTGVIDYSQLPNTLPGYLIYLKADFMQDGVVVQSAPAGAMGSELYETLSLWSPTFGWNQTVNYPTAGEYRAIGLDLQGLNLEEASKLRSKMAKTRSIVGSRNTSLLGTLTREDLLGDLMYATIYNYFVANNEQNELEAKTNNIVSYRLPSYGIFSTSLQTNYWLGLPRNVSSDGLEIDVDRLAIQVVSKDNDKTESTSYVESIGARGSALEHVVPEEIWSTNEGPAEGVSAVKAIQLALEEGQRVWSVGNDNIDSVLSQITITSEIRSKIQGAVNAGKVVTLHDEPVVYSSLGSSIYGYIITDPSTGAGAYQIGSGTNGGKIDAPDSGLISFFPIEALTSVVEKFGPVLQKLYDCVVENFEAIVAAVVIAIIVALFIKLIAAGGLLGGAILFGAASAYASSAAAGSKPDECGLTCGDHFTNCLGSSLQTQAGPLFGSGACVSCQNQCVQNEGVWPDIARVFQGSQRCDYWNF